MQPSPAPACALSPALLKLIEIIGEENGVLRRQEFVSHAGFTDRKNQVLRELMAAQRREALPAATARVRPLLEQLSDVLHENARLLKLHIAAVGEISDIIVGSLREADSDETRPRRRGDQVGDDEHSRPPGR